MAVITFRFSKSADRPTQESLLHGLEASPGVRAVGRIDAESRDSDIMRMCFAETGDADSASIVEKLHNARGIEAVSVESDRGLL